MSNPDTSSPRATRWPARRWPCTRRPGGPATATRSARCWTTPAAARAPWPAWPGARCPPGSGRRPPARPAGPDAGSPVYRADGLVHAGRAGAGLRPAHAVPGHSGRPAIPSSGGAMWSSTSPWPFRVAAAGLGGLPLWLLMLRRAYREQRRRDMACLLRPLIAPAAYLAGLSVTVRLVAGPGVSPWWFLVLTLVGFAFAARPRPGPAWPCAGCSHGARPCAWPRPRAAWRRRPWWWPPWPSSSRSPGCACGRRLRRLPPRRDPRRLPGPGRGGRRRHRGQRRPRYPRRARRRKGRLLRHTSGVTPTIPPPRLAPPSRWPPGSTWPHGARDPERRREHHRLPATVAGGGQGRREHPRCPGRRPGLAPARTRRRRVPGRRGRAGRAAQPGGAGRHPPRRRPGDVVLDLPAAAARRARCGQTRTPSARCSGTCTPSCGAIPGRPRCWPRCRTSPPSWPGRRHASRAGQAALAAAYARLTAELAPAAPSSNCTATPAAAT